VRKHTPGPWRVVDLRHQQRGKFQILGATHRHVANVLLLGVADPPTTDPRLDAILIAAAPELLAACGWALERLSLAESAGDSKAHVECERLRRIIAKAEGRST